MKSTSQEDEIRTRFVLKSSILIFALFGIFLNPCSVQAGPQALGGLARGVQLYLVAMACPFLVVVVSACAKSAILNATIRENSFPRISLRRCLGVAFGEVCLLLWCYGWLGAIWFRIREYDAPGAFAFAGLSLIFDKYWSPNSNEIHQMILAAVGCTLSYFLGGLLLNQLFITRSNAEGPVKPARRSLRETFYSIVLAGISWLLLMSMWLVILPQLAR
jgi:hypothetical protein